MSDLEFTDKAQESYNALMEANKQLESAEADLEQKETVAENATVGSEEEHTEEAVVVENATSEPVTQEQPAPEQYSDVEKDAIEKGWKPDGGPKTAEEYIRSEPLYKEISASHKRIKELKDTVDQLSAHMQKQQEIGYTKAIKELEQAKVEAIQLGDVDAVHKIEEEIKQHAPAAEPARHESAEAKSFFQRHENWLQDPSYEAQKMREFAEKRDKELLTYNLSAEEHIKIIEKDLHGEFPQKFEPIENKAPAAVEAPRGKPPVKKELGIKDLNSAEKEVYRYLNRSNPTGAKAYLKQLHDMREAGG